MRGRRRAVTMITACTTSRTPASRPGAPGIDARDLFARVALTSLCLALAVRFFQDFSRTGRVTGLMLVACEALVVVVTVTRRPATGVDRRWSSRTVAVLSAAGPMLSMPLGDAVYDAEAITAVVACAGLCITTASILTLGRSFGFVPANRGIVSSGPYRLVRHPVYFGYLVNHGAFLAASPLAWNIAVLVIADIALVVRCFREEETLSGDPAYVRYRARVRWRLLPYVL